MLDNFFAVIDVLDERGLFEEWGASPIMLTAAMMSAEALTLTLELWSGADEPTQVWKVICHSSREHKVVLGETERPTPVCDDHVLLWPYQKEAQELSFYAHGSALNASAIVGQLYSVHQQLVADWIPFSRFFNVDQLSLSDLIAGGFGTLALGPEPLTQQYQRVLDEAGCKTSVLPRKLWIGDRPAMAGEDDKVSVLILGEAYVIAEKFTAARVEASSSADAE